MSAKVDAEFISSDSVIFHVHGKLNEDQNPWDKLTPLHPKTAHINLENLKSMNSVGIRSMKSWLHQLKSEEIQISMCPKVFIDQINMIAEFLPAQAVIASFFVPYFSEETNEEKVVLYTRDVQYHVNNGNIQLNHPEVLDPEGKKMILDVFPETFFQFLKAHG